MINYFYLGGEQLTDSDLFGDDWQIGYGVVWSNCERYRVVDIWFSLDHHGQMDEGRHIFMEPVTTPEDDRPKQMLPAYFVDDVAVTESFD